MFIYFEYEFHTQPYASGKKPGGHKSANMLTTNACGLMVPKASSIVQRPSTTDSEISATFSSKVARMSMHLTRSWYRGTCYTRRG